VAGKPQYSDEQKARAYSLFVTNAENVKQTARELGMPSSTLRRWRDDWNRLGPPDITEVVIATGAFLDDAERVRNLALAELERKLPDATAAQLVQVVGTLDDKIARAKGLADRVTEHKITLPSADDIRDKLAELGAMAQDAARRREEEIVDAEIVEPRALGSGT